jgi:hypothetical protein
MQGCYAVNAATFHRGHPVHALVTTAEFLDDATTNPHLVRGKT